MKDVASGAVVFLERADLARSENRSRLAEAIAQKLGVQEVESELVSQQPKRTFGPPFGGWRGRGLLDTRELRHKMRHSKCRNRVAAVESCPSAPENFPAFPDLACRNPLLHKDLAERTGFEPAEG